ncbi:ACT domain-containing protein, partial [Thermogladius sp.]|uniref:ACT domain-containing protein n=1 Tax=Thermogladius sp. TaxID=2023064 RepID=UPI003D0CC0C9
VSPVENVYTPGLIAYVTSLLAQAGINIVQITSSYSETMMVVSPEDTVKASNVLNDAISRARKKSGRRF